MNFRKLTLLQKALLALIVILLPIIISFVHSYLENRDQIKKHTLDDLTVIAEAYEGQVYQFLEMVRRRALDFSSDGYVVSGIKRVQKGEKGAAEALSAHFRKNKLPLDKSIFRVSVLSMDGRVLASTDPAKTGQDESAEAYFKKASSGMTAIEEQRVLSHTPEIVAAAPVYAPGGAQIGVMALAQHLSDLSRVLTGELNRELGALSWSKGKRETMEAYIVNRDRFLITESRFIEGAVLKQKVENEAVDLCLERREEFSGFYADYRGVEVAGASMCLPSMGWTLLVEVDSSEILAPVEEIRKDALVAALAASGLVFIVFWAFYRNMILRLAALSSATSRIASGHYDISVPVASGDEIGLLSENFSRMSGEIRSRATLLKESEEKYRSLVANIPDITWTADSSGAIVFVSSNVMRLFGYRPEEVCHSIGFWESLIYPEDRGRIMAAFEALFESGRPFDEQYRMRRKDGSFAWVYDRASSTYEKNGEKLTDGVLTDITQRKMADLLQSITLYLKEAETFDSAIRVVISKICELTGWSYGEVWMPRSDGSVIEHSSIWQGSAPEHERFAGLSMSSSLKPGVGVPGKVWQERRPVWICDLSVDGDDFVRANAAAEAGLKCALGVPVIENGNVLAVLVFLMSEPLQKDSRTIDFVAATAAQLGSSLQKKLSEDARTEMQRKYEELLDSITVGVYRDSFSGDGRLIEVNRAVVTMLEGSSSEEVLSHQSADFYVDKERRAELAAKLALDGFLKGEELELVTLKGKRIWVAISAVRKAGPNGAEYVDGIIEDISERRRLEEQLRHSQKLEAVGQLAGGIAHDFNNILTAIIGYGNLLIMKKGEDDIVRSYSEHVLTLSEKAAQLTQSLLAFSRKQVINLQPIEINGLIQRVEKILERVIGEDIELKTSLVGRETTIKADSTHLEQVFMNLATNARDAMAPGGGVLSISTEIAEIGPEFLAQHGYGEPGTYVLINVSDSGSGMDEETRKRIFEPFFTTKEVGKGTGLGLAVVYGIIKQHNGYINVYSSPGMGSTFKIYLPIIEESIEALASEQPDEIKGGRETILLAEDEPAVREVNKSILEEFGYTIIEAVDGEDAVSKFRERSAGIDLLLLDLIMPKKNGREAYEEILRIRPDIKAIFMSGYAADLMRAKGALHAGVDLISKPVAPGELLRKVRETIER